MNTQKAAYWFALVLFGFVVHSEYQRGAFPAVHGVANRAGDALAQVVSRSQCSVAAAELFASCTTFETNDLLGQAKNQLDIASIRELAGARQEFREQARDKSELLCDQLRAQVAMARAQVDLDRAQIDQIRRPEVQRALRNLHRGVLEIQSGDWSFPSTGVTVISNLDSPDDDQD